MREVALTVRFVLELCALAALAWRGVESGSGALGKIALAVFGAAVAALVSTDHVGLGVALAVVYVVDRAALAARPG